MDPDLKLVLDAWRVLLVENERLRQEIEQLKKQAGSSGEPEMRYRKLRGDRCED